MEVPSALADVIFLAPTLSSFGLSGFSGCICWRLLTTSDWPRNWKKVITILSGLYTRRLSHAIKLERTLDEPNTYRLLTDLETVVIVLYWHISRIAAPCLFRSPLLVHSLSQSLDPTKLVHPTARIGSSPDYILNPASTLTPTTDCNRRRYGLEL